MSRFIFSIACLLLLLLLGCMPRAYSTDDLSYASPPPKCDLTLGSWCILRDNLIITKMPDHKQGFHDIWTISGSYWTKQPAVIFESSGCRDGISDTVRMVSFEPDYIWKGRQWNAITVNLKKDGTCKLRLLAPTLAADPGGAAFTFDLTGIRVCESAPCEGSVLAKYIWPRVQRK